MGLLNSSESKVLSKSMATGSSTTLREPHRLLSNHPSIFLPSEGLKVKLMTLNERCMGGNP
ncbi:UNVERIFIED_CONTAM: hypothetical protein Sradi_1543600 [Sesamum radiatum]